MLANLRRFRFFEVLIVIGSLGTYGFCLLTVLAQFAPPTSSLEMVSSFLPHILVVGVISSFLVAIYRPRVAAAGAFVVFLAALPFVFFSKHQSPTGAVCGPSECLTVISANIYGLPDAMVRLGEIAAREQADIVSVFEAVRRVDDDAYKRVFPMHDEIIHAAPETIADPIGMPLSLLSRQPILRRDRVIHPEAGYRAYLIADLGEQWHGTRLVATHTLVPVMQPGLIARDKLLEVAGAAAEESETFIMMGDFNLTPWTPAFRDLPGKRAGDPRFTATWPVAFGLFGIPIDHILFSDDLELVEYRILEPTGADHRPILAKFKRKGRE